jgi:hypothetical protein
MLSSDSSLYHVECSILIAVLALLGLTFLARRLERRRPGLRLQRGMLAAFLLRTALAVALQVASSTGRRLRGPDDASFIHAARVLGAGPIPSTSWASHLVGDLNTALLAVQVKVLSDPGDLSLRIAEITFVVAGLLFLVAAVYDLAGPRASHLALWLGAIEPSSVFFASMIQKESLALFGEGVLTLGCARAWRKVDAGAIGLICAGCAVVFAVRSYAGAFLLVASICVVASAGIRRLPDRRRIWVAVLASGAVIFGIALVAISPVGTSELRQLQSFQEDGATNSNLQLEPVNFSTVGGLVSGLPLRVRDYLLKPYPWQQQDLSQKLGTLPTLLAWLLIGLVLLSLAIHPRAWLRQAPPLAIPVLFVTLCYSLTTANAGTGFRHRTHLLFLLVGLASILWADQLPSWESLRNVLRRSRRDSSPTTA